MNLCRLLINALKAQACEIRGCEETYKYNENIKQASEEDWSTEYFSQLLV